MPLNRFLGMMCDALDEAPSRLMGLQQRADEVSTSHTLEERSVVDVLAELERRRTDALRHLHR